MIQPTDTRDPGQALGEYTLILAFVALVCVTVLGTIGSDVVAVLTSVSAGF